MSTIIKNLDIGSSRSSCRLLIKNCDKLSDLSLRSATPADDMNLYLTPSDMSNGGRRRAIGIYNLRGGVYSEIFDFGKFNTKYLSYKKVVFVTDPKKINSQSSFILSTQNNFPQIITHKKDSRHVKNISYNNPSKVTLFNIDDFINFYKKNPDKFSLKTIIKTT
jgi:hypothetical protein